MPITVTAPRGVLTPSGERAILPRLTEALIEVSGLTGNEFFAAVVGGTVHLLDPRDVYAGGVNRPVVMVELKLPNIGLADQTARGVHRGRDRHRRRPGRAGASAGRHVGQHSERAGRGVGAGRQGVHRRCADRRDQQLTGRLSGRLTRPAVPPVAPVVRVPGRLTTLGGCPA